MPRMDDFNRATALAMAKLYEAFPTPIRLTVRELEEGVTDDKAKLYFESIMFLAQNGFIRYHRSKRYEYFGLAVLTAQGLALLNEVPDSLKQQKSRGQIITEAAREGSKGAVNAAVEGMISASVSGLIRGLGGG
jgi:hypothetical protein